MSSGDIGRCEASKSVYETVRTYIKADSAFDVKKFTEHECIKRFMLRKDRTAAKRRHAAEATRRRRRILHCRILFYCSSIVFVPSSSPIKLATAVKVTGLSA